MSSSRLVLDSSPLNYFTRSDQLPVLEKLVAAHQCHITSAVHQELLIGASKYAKLYQASAQPWITVAGEAALQELAIFSEYHRRLGGGSRNIGEATTLAYAEFHGITAVVDDKTGRRHGEERGVKVTGTLELLCQGIRDRILSTTEAAAVVDVLCDHEAYLPCDGAGFFAWARTEGLLD